jgi:hypothetical protein
MLWRDMYPHVIVSLEPGDAVFFWQDVVYSGVAYKEDCNHKCFISVLPERWESFENAIISSVRNWAASVQAGLARQPSNGPFYRRVAMRGNMCSRIEQLELEMVLQVQLHFKTPGL